MKALVLLFYATALAVQAQTFTTLASFDGTNGNSPKGLLQGSDGNFYGMASTAIFKMTPNGLLTALYTFPKDVNPTAFIQASDGNFYGTTAAPGGAGGANQGTIFKLTPAGAYTTLYALNSSTGSPPTALLQGLDGNLYGTTEYGGSSANASSVGYGTIFKITLSGTFSVLHNFMGSDGSGPNSLIQGMDGNFYGVTYSGGSGNCQSSVGASNGCGVFFQATPAGVITTVYTFEPNGDGKPQSLISGADGNFYGTSQFGGPDNCTFSGNATGCGTILKFTPGGSLTTIYTFGATAAGSSGPNLLMQASDGDFYGASDPAEIGSCSGLGCGTLFQLTPAGVKTILYEFPPTSTGSEVVTSLVQGADGNFYGTTQYSGASDDGTIFKLSVVSDTPAIATSGGVLNGASFQPGISAGSWITINGTNLSSKTDTWNNSIIKGALPTMLDGVSAMVDGQPAYIEYVSPRQINAVAPDVPAGTVPVTVTNANGTSTPVNAQLTAEQPAFFQWGNYAVATRQDFSRAVKNGTFAGTTTVPAKPGDVIILWGTGFGPTSPSTPVGAETPSTTTYNTATSVSVKIGTQSATVYGAALAPGYAGLYQIAIQIPAGLADGDYPVIATINGVQSPSTTLITVQQ